MNQNQKNVKVGQSPMRGASIYSNDAWTLQTMNSEVSLLLGCYCEEVLLGNTVEAEARKTEAFEFNQEIATYWFSKTSVKEAMVEARQRFREEGMSIG